MRSPALVLFLAALLLLILTGCGGGGSNAGEVSRPVSAEAERQRDSDGAATLRSTVLVQFPKSLALDLQAEALRDAVRIRTSGERPRDLAVESVAVSREDATVLVIETSELVPDNSEFRIGRSAFVRDAAGSVSTRIAGDLTRCAAELASYALGPAEGSVDAFFADSESPRVTLDDRTTDRMREALQAHLEARGSAPDTAARALETFDGMSDAIVQSPKLRAALSALTGTFAEPAIVALTTADNCTGRAAERIAFEVPPDFSGLLARVTNTEAGTRVVSIHPILEGEPFQLLMPLLMHEAIHCDGVSGVDEETAATALDSYLYLMLIAAEPWLAQEGTTLARNFNVDALALLNSGRILPESVGVLQSPGGHSIFPGTELDYTSFAEYLAAAYDESGPGPSPEEPLAQRYVANLAEPEGLPVSNAFNLEYLDGLLGATLPLEVLSAAMEALGLELVR